MKPETIGMCLLPAIAAILLAMPAGLAAETVEMSIDKTLQLESAVVDLAMSSDGSRLFVLNDQGELLVYSANGEIQGRIPVGKDVDQITVATKGDRILLSSSKNKTVQMVSLDFIVDIDISGSPFQGREDAPVVVSVFTDFQ